MRYLIYCFAVLIFSFSLTVAEAQNEVVVVPLGGKKCTSPSENSFTNSIGMTFNLIPSGTFIMGSPVSEPGRDSNETQHQVTLTKPFYMSVTEVTNKQWNSLIVTTGLGVNPSTSHTGDNYPVEKVYWFEAAYFANALSLREGRSQCYTLTGCSPDPGDGMECTGVSINASCTGYRLPTEAQWEYAARAGTTTAYANPFSFDATNTETVYGFNSNLHAMGWYEFNNEGGDLSRYVSAYPSGTKPVAQKQPNRWGLYDMHGNVYEWCQDWNGLYPPGLVIDPQGPVNGSVRVMRGGGWYDEAELARSANRSYNAPGIAGYDLGFRLVLSPGQ